MESRNFPPALTQATEVTMAQADYVTNAIRALITGVGVKPSTKPGRMAGGLDLRQIDAFLSELASNVTCILQYAVEGIAWRVA